MFNTNGTNPVEAYRVIKIMDFAEELGEQEAAVEVLDRKAELTVKKEEAEFKTKHAQTIGRLRAITGSNLDPMQAAMTCIMWDKLESKAEELLDSKFATTSSTTEQETPPATVAKASGK